MENGKYDNRSYRELAQNNIELCRERLNTYEQLLKSESADATVILRQIYKQVYAAFDELR